MSELAKNPPSLHFYDAMLAVSALDGEDWWQVHQRIEQNHKLWAFEDRNVPKALVIRYSWYENGIMYGPHEETFSIILPASRLSQLDLKCERQGVKGYEMPAQGLVPDWYWRAYAARASSLDLTRSGLGDSGLLFSTTVFDRFACCQAKIYRIISAGSLSNIASGISSR